MELCGLAAARQSSLVGDAVLSELQAVAGNPRCWTCRNHSKSRPPCNATHPTTGQAFVISVSWAYPRNASMWCWAIGTMLVRLFTVNSLTQTAESLPSKTRAHCGDNIMSCDVARLCAPRITIFPRINRPNVSLFCHGRVTSQDRMLSPQCVTVSFRQTVTAL